MENKTNSQIKYCNQYDAIENYLKSNYNFRFNEVILSVEYSLKGTDNWIILSEYEEHSIYISLKKARYKIPYTEFDILINSTFSKKVNPVRDYIYSLPPWDTTTDYIQKLADTVTTTKSDFWNKAFKKWFVAMIASALDDKIVNQSVIVFHGKQGAGKSTWFNTLLPNELKQYYHAKNINPKCKDALRLLSEKILINLEELTIGKKTEAEVFKEMVTLPEIETRIVFGKRHTKIPRLASLVASVNESEFINDPTGSRRLLVFDIKVIDYKHNIPIDKVISQAKYLFEHGYKYYFDGNEIDEILENNTEYCVSTNEESLILKRYKPIAPHKANIFMTATDIVEDLINKENSRCYKLNIMTIGKYLKLHGFAKVKKKGLYKWALARIEDEVAVSKKLNITAETPEVEEIINTLF